MGLFNELKKSKSDKEFFDWLNNVLQAELKSEIKAVNFNLYEDVNNKWSIEMVGTSTFDENNEDWACCEVFTTRDNSFVIVRESNWKAIEALFIDLLNKYLIDGRYAYKLKKYQAIGIGFVDGDLHILYKR